MNAHNPSHAVIVTLLACFVAGCHSNFPVTKRSELTALAGRAGLKILCAGNTVYDLETFVLRDSAIYGVGTMMRNDTTRTFNGQVPLTAVRYLQGSRGDGFKTVLAIAAVGFVGWTALSYMGEGENTLVSGTVVTRYDPRYTPGHGGGGGSCPYVYSWNGAHYALDGEAYSVAWGKALEMESVTMLPSLRPENGLLRVRLTNERPESHYYNNLSLVAVQTDANATIVPDPDGRFWPVGKTLPPGRATEGGRTDVLERLTAVDGRYWESSLAETYPGSTFEDVIELVLPGSAGSREGTLVVDAVNSRIFDVVLGKISTLLGDDYLTFVQAAEEDPEMTGLLAGWLNDAALNVAVWTGKRWKPAGRIMPEGTAAPFRCGVRLQAEDLQSDSVIVRLTSLPGVWEIDAVGIDWTPASPHPAQEVGLVAASGPSEKPVQQALASADGRYVTVLPGQQIDCTFREPKSAPHKRTSYALRVRGYLHEWPTGDKISSPEFTVASMSGGAKISYLKALLRMKWVVLPPIYAEWKQAKM